MIDNVGARQRPDPNTCIAQAILSERLDFGFKDAFLYEKTSRKKDRLTHLAALSIHDPDSQTLLSWAAYDIVLNPSEDPGLDSRITLIYSPTQHITSLENMRSQLEEYALSLVTGPLSFMNLHGPPPLVCRRKDQVNIVDTAYDTEKKQWSMVYQLEPDAMDAKISVTPSASASASLVDSIDIRNARADADTETESRHASWDYDKATATSPLQLASSLRHRKTSFMSSSLLVPPSNPSTAIRPKLSKPNNTSILSSSLNDHESDLALRFRSSSWKSSPESRFMGAYLKANENHTDAPCIVIEIDHVTWTRTHAVDMTISVNSMNETLTLTEQEAADRFAYLCVRCFEDRRHGRKQHLIGIYHPSQLMQYLLQESNEAAARRVDEAIQVSLILQPREYATERQDHFRLYVNEKPWPVRGSVGRVSWADDIKDDALGSASENEYLVTDDDTSSIGTRDESGKEDHGIFVHEMDEIDDMDDVDDVDETTPKTSKSSGPPPALNLTLEKRDTAVTSSDSLPASEPSMGAEHTRPDEANEKTTERTEYAPVETPNMSTTDPLAIQQAESYFQTLTASEGWETVQQPEASNRFVTIEKLPIAEHPTGAFMSRALWKDCSIWDVKAVISSIGARKMWDTTFNDASLLGQISPTCTLWHVKIKGFWPFSPRDYVAYQASYSSASRIDVCATSCLETTFDHHPIPEPESGHIRALLDLWGWRLERVDDHTTSVKFISQANPQGWIPSYIPNSFSGHNPDIVQRARQYFEKHDAPPDLVRLGFGKLITVSLDQSRPSWRAEYVRATELIAKGLRPVNAPSTVATIRVGSRYWREQGCSVVVDPPPTRVQASVRETDAYGLWLDIEHDEEFIIPQSARILVLIKPGSDKSAGVLINGVATDVYDPSKPTHTTEPVETASSRTTAPSTSVTPSTNKAAQQTSVDLLSRVIRQPPPPLSIEPIPFAAAALKLVRRLDEQQFGWDSVSEKNGLRVSKRPGAKKNKSSENTSSSLEEIYEPFMTIRATRVIEGFSLEEVASVVTSNSNLRKQYDETIEQVKRIRYADLGCEITYQVMKSVFPLKSREIYLCAATAQEKVPSTTNPSAERTFYVETHIPHYPAAKNEKRPRAQYFLSGWILEAIDPYTTTTNHPIPSMRATYLATVDLGTGVPAYMSNLVTSNLTKRINLVESYLKTQGPPPYLCYPRSAASFCNGSLSTDIMQTSEAGTVKWQSVHNTYDETMHHYVVDCTLRAEYAKEPEPSPKSNLSLRLKKAQQLAPSAETTKTSPRRASLSTSSVASSSFTVTRAGSLAPSSLEGSTMAKPKPTASSSSPTTHRGSLKQDEDHQTLLLHAVVDLCKFDKGYEVSITLTRFLTHPFQADTEETKDVSNILSVQVEEVAPEPSHLIVSAGKKRPRKHTVRIYAKSVSLMRPSREKSGRYLHHKLSMRLTPTTEECLAKRGTRLTVSGVLGEDDDTWKGMVMVNGEEMNIGSQVGIAPSKSTAPGSDEEDVSLHSPPPNEDAESHVPESPVLSQGQASPNTGTGVGGAGGTGTGVMAAALEGMSAGVNDFRARMLLPFRASTSFLAQPALDDDDERYTSLSSGSEASGEEEDLIPTRVTASTATTSTTTTKPLSTINVPVSTVRRRGRSMSEVRKRRTSEFVRLLRFALVALLLAVVMIWFLFQQSPTEQLSPSLVGSQMRRLGSIPWYSGWEVQLVAVRVPPAAVET
ncbi:hypothetical protein BCR43DRAFT_302856 [Syncephalastrum racemosum]|uniref:START domain-containing protein n=1 Tax=Syncephalastrum racemosum TaxID=13706 RepID=A0A1X2H9Z8_SYNRA|nr:hypothetical protein BCR43DRAFT_302856 [Syncephalastrum racemosum]